MFKVGDLISHPKFKNIYVHKIIEIKNNGYKLIGKGRDNLDSPGFVSFKTAFADFQLHKKNNRKKLKLNVKEKK